jgi:hypothetical protein
MKPFVELIAPRMQALDYVQVSAATKKSGPFGGRFLPPSVAPGLSAGAKP